MRFPELMTWLSTAVSELSKYMDEANMIHYKSLLRATKYVIETKYYFWQMKTDRNINGPWELSVYSDADYTGDNDSRKSVIGYIFSN